MYCDEIFGVVYLNYLYATRATESILMVYFTCVRYSSSFDLIPKQFQMKSRFGLSVLPTDTIHSSLSG